MQDFDLRTYLPYLLNRVGFAVTDLFSEALQAEELSVPMWRVLAVLHHGGDQRMGRLAELTSIEFSTLSRLVNGMAKRRLLVRRRTSDDARVVNVALSQRGRTLTLRLLPAAMALEERLTAGLASRDLDELKRILDALYFNMRPNSASRADRASA